MPASRSGGAQPEFLVETEWLATQLGAPDLCVIDCTVHIGFDPQAEPCYTVASGREDFERGHIPGAQFVDVVTELSDPANPVPLMAPSVTDFAAVMSRVGVGNKSRVVLYSGQNAYWATRVWWLLRMFGFDNAALLDGGWQKWRREGRPVETGPARLRRPARFVVRAERDLMATKAEVFAAIGDTAVCTINALPADQHNFTSGVHYGRPGHIAGSVNVPSADLLNPETNEFLSPAELRQRFEAVGAFDKRVITYCGGGIAAAADAMALVMLGHPDVKLYDGSLCEWAADPSVPMEASPVPISPNQAIVAFENRRLAAELREALDQQTAMTEVLQVINSAHGDLAPVFDAMLEKAMWLCEAAFGSLAGYDGDRFHALAHRGVPAEMVDRLRAPQSPDGAFARLVAGENVVHIADVKDDDAYRAGLRGRVAMADIGGARTAIWVALRKEAALVGTFVIFRQEVRPFTDRQIALLQNFAAQAVIAMENARLITETREALERQTATAEVLGVINSSPGDLTPVFEEMLERARRLCEPALGVLLTWDGERFHRVAWRGASPEVIEAQREPVIGPPGSPGYRIAHGEDVVSIADLAENGVTRHAPAMQILLRFGVHSYVAVALRKEGMLLGAIVIYRLEVRPFTDKEITLLQNFAAQAVIAMENARLITETREALEQQTATADVLGVINSSPGDLAPVFDAMLDKAMTLCGAAFGALMSYDGEKVSAVATRGLPPELVDVFRGQIAPRRDGDAPYARFLRGEPLLHIVDMAAADVLPSLASRPRALVEKGGARTGLEIPLRKEGVLLGSIWLYRQEVRPFSDKQIALLQNFAAQAVIAMENARLMTETREALEQQTATADILGVINASPGQLEPVFGTIVEKAQGLCEAAFSCLGLFEGEALRFAATSGPAFASDFFDPRRLHPPDGCPYVVPLSRAKRTVQTADLTAERGYREERDPFYVITADAGGARTVLRVPLLREQELLGHLWVFRREVRPFTDKQVALLQNFASQAVIAMENARLLTETREALEQQTATAEVLGVINSSPGDLAPVFDAMLDKALHLCEASFGILWTYDGERGHASALHDVPPTAVDFFTQRPHPVGPDNGLGLLLRGDPLVHISDVAATELYRHGDDPLRRALVELCGARTVLGVPLRKDSAFLGAFFIYRQEVRPFSDKQIALLQNFAAQAVIAMENARLLGELRERNAEIAGWNQELETRVAAQLAEIERTGKLRRFLAPQLADLIVREGDESILESHRREIVVVFCDLRGFTAFAERAEPEEVMALLKDYHAVMGPIVARFEGTIDHYGGDGIMVFFNDPLPTPDPARRAIDMAAAMREAAQPLLRGWRRHGHDLGFGVGIAQGYATLGQIGFAERMDYTAIGTVTNLAARLCAEAKDGQILVGARVAAAVEENLALEEIGDLALKGLSQAVAVYNVP